MLSTHRYTHVTEQVSNMSWDKDSTESVGEAKKQLQDMRVIKELERQIRKRNKNKRGKRRTVENISAEYTSSVSHKDVMFSVKREHHVSEKLRTMCS